MTREDLNNKWWYRLIQVVYGVIIAIIVFIYGFTTITEHPRKVYDDDNSYVKCLNTGETFNLTQNGIYTYGQDLSYSDIRKFKLACGTEEQKDSVSGITDIRIDSWDNNFTYVKVYTS